MRCTSHVLQSAVLGAVAAGFLGLGGISIASAQDARSAVINPPAQSSVMAGAGALGQATGPHGVMSGNAYANQVRIQQQNDQIMEQQRLQAQQQRLDLQHQRLEQQRLQQQQRLNYGSSNFSARSLNSPTNLDNTLGLPGNQ